MAANLVRTGMGLMLQMPTLARSHDEGAASAPVGVVAATAGQPPAAGKLPQRAELKAAHLARNYDYVFRARLSHIPMPLPYHRNEILSRLKEVDGLPSNRERRERRLELETDLSILARDIERPLRKENWRERRERRLSNVWDYLVANASRTKILITEREGRLRFCVLMFFRSDLPASFLAEYGSSTQWEIAALALATNASGQRVIQRLTGRPAEEVNRDVFLKTEATPLEIDRAFREYNARRLAVTSVSDMVLGWRDALEYYIDLYSAPDLRAFRELRTIDVSSLDGGVIDELTDGLRSATADLRRVLAKEYPGGISELQWMPRGDPYVGGLVRLELEEAEAG